MSFSGFLSIVKFDAKL